MSNDDDKPKTLKLVYPEPDESPRPVDQPERDIKFAETGKPKSYSMSRGERIFKLTGPQLCRLRDAWGDGWLDRLDGIMTQMVTLNSVHVDGTMLVAVADDDAPRDRLCRIEQSSNHIEAAKRAKLAGISLHENGYYSGNFVIVTVEGFEDALMDVEAEHTLLNMAYDLPVLEGSQKQVEWANNVRRKLVPEINDYLIKRRGVDEKFMVIANQVIYVNECRWWIDHRRDHVHDIVIEYVFEKMTSQLEYEVARQFPAE